MAPDPAASAKQSGSRKPKAKDAPAKDKKARTTAKTRSSAINSEAENGGGNETPAQASVQKKKGAATKKGTATAKAVSQLKRKSASSSRAPSDKDDDAASDGDREVPQAKKSKPNRPTSSTKKTPAAVTDVIAVARANQLEKHIADLEARLASETASRKKAEQEVKELKVQKEKKLIPRPPGERGKNGWNLQQHIGLGEKPDLYNAIRRCVRYAVHEARLNIHTRINQQDARSLAYCFELVKDRFPMMAKFEGNWATREFIKGICQNARRHCRRKGIDSSHLPQELLDEGVDDDEGGNGDLDQETSTAKKGKTRALVDDNDNDNDNDNDDDDDDSSDSDDSDSDSGDGSDSGEDGEDGEGAAKNKGSSDEEEEEAEKDVDVEMV